MHTCLGSFVRPPGSRTDIGSALRRTYEMSHRVPCLAAARHRMMRTRASGGHSRDISLFITQKGVAQSMLRQPLCHRAYGLSRRCSPKAQLTLALALPSLPLPDASSLQSLGALKWSSIIANTPSALPRPPYRACHVLLCSIMQQPLACSSSLIEELQDIE